MAKVNYFTQGLVLNLYGRKIEYFGDFNSAKTYYDKRLSGIRELGLERAIPFFYLIDLGKFKSKLTKDEMELFMNYILKEKDYMETKRDYLIGNIQNIKKLLGGK